MAQWTRLHNKIAFSRLLHLILVTSAMGTFYTLPRSKPEDVLTNLAKHLPNFENFSQNISADSFVANFTNSLQKFEIPFSFNIGMKDLSQFQERNIQPPEIKLPDLSSESLKKTLKNFEALVKIEALEFSDLFCIASFFGSDLVALFILIVDLLIIAKGLSRTLMTWQVVCLLLLCSIGMTVNGILLLKNLSMFDRALFSGMACLTAVAVSLADALFTILLHRRARSYATIPPST